MILPLIRTAITDLRPLSPAPVVELSSDLCDDLHLDSLDRITVAMALEEALRLEIRDHEVSAWRTVADIVRTVEGKRRAA